MKKKIPYKLILALLALVYVGFAVGKTFYQSWTVNQEVAELKNEIENLRESNLQMEQNLQYYQSDSYKERIARERFNLQKPGEEVIVIVPNDEPIVTVEEKPKEKSNPEKWYDFLF